jgi:hypothetical protein
MARQQDIKNLLIDAAPLFHSIALEAQKDAGALAETDWAKTHITREASLNQITGTARWRMVGDRVARRQGELPKGLELSTDEDEHNSGRYYLRGRKLGIVLTIRRKPHKKDDQPELLQLQIEQALEFAPIAYADEIVVYLAVGAVGTRPQFDVVNRGEVVDTYFLADLIEDAGKQKRATPASITPADLPKATVSSALNPGGAKEDSASAEN